MYKTILVPIDRAHLAEGKTSILIAQQHASKDTRIILLNVVEEVPNWVAIELPVGVMGKMKQAARDELKALATGDNMTVEVRSGSSYSTILDVAEEKQADLIIIASHRPGLQDYFLGSTASKVVRHAVCSVLVVR